MINAQFDGLAQGYDRHRPRYPQVLIEKIARSMPDKSIYTIADIGAGTGIALEGLIPTLGEEHVYHAVDISNDMIDFGRRKFPHVFWHHGKAEEIVSRLPSLDLILAAQSFQWMDRQSMLTAALPKLSPGGVFAILQNNRDFSSNVFLDEYETLLEEMSPNYHRFYRVLDFQAVLAKAFSCRRDMVECKTHDWSTSVPVDAFISMSQSSTQVQRAIATHGETYLQRLKSLLDKHQHHGLVELRYNSQLFLIRKSKMVANDIREL